MEKLKLFSALLVIFAALWTISCGEEGETKNETAETESEDGRTYGFWRLAGVVDVPPGWDPVEDPDLFEIMFGDTYPQDPITDVTTIQWSGPHAVSPEGCRWTFKTRGTYGDPWGLYEYFSPKEWWWSHPESNPSVVRKTWVRGYVLDGEDYVLADEDISKNPKNPPGGPYPDWKYGHHEGPYDCGGGTQFTSTCGRSVRA
jgi:hypothetical protein